MMTTDVVASRIVGGAYNALLAPNDVRASIGARESLCAFSVNEPRHEICFACVASLFSTQEIMNGVVFNGLDLGAL